MPALTVAATGYGAGKKQFGERPNLLRVVIGESPETAGPAEAPVVHPGATLSFIKASRLGVCDSPPLNAPKSPYPMSSTRNRTSCSWST